MSHFRSPRRIAAVLGLTAVAAAGGGAIVAQADSTPVGKLPKGPRATMSVKAGELVSFALPAQSDSSGLVWRVARKYDSDVLEQVSEGDLDGAVVLVYKAVGSGRATVRFALTKGDASADARQSRTYAVTVR